MKLSLDPPAPRRRPSLTPMIDVVFLLLVFFMLASRFGAETSLPLQLTGQGAAWSGPPRLVEIGPEALRLNGVAVAPGDLPAQLGALTDSPGDPVLLRGRDGAALQRLVEVMDLLAAAGFTGAVLVE